MNRYRLVLVALIAVMVFSACGKRGPLESPAESGMLDNDPNQQAIITIVSSPEVIEAVTN